MNANLKTGTKRISRASFPAGAAKMKFSGCEWGRQPHSRGRAIEAASFSGRQADDATASPMSGKHMLRRKRACR
jgi:hypothetical protein